MATQSLLWSYPHTDMMDLAGLGSSRTFTPSPAQTRTGDHLGPSLS